MRILITLYRIKVLTPIGLYYLIIGILREGITLNALLYYCAKMFSGNSALIHNKVSVSYTQFYTRSLNLAKSFMSIHKMASNNRVALIVRNSTEAVIALFALSRTGFHIYLVNPEMSQQQFLKLAAKHPQSFAR